jgi:hypothetical protein
LERVADCLGIEASAHTPRAMSADSMANSRCSRHWGNSTNCNTTSRRSDPGAPSGRSASVSGYPSSMRTAVSITSHSGGTSSAAAKSSRTSSAGVRCPRSKKLGKRVVHVAGSRKLFLAQPTSMSCRPQLLTEPERYASPFAASSGRDLFYAGFVWCRRRVARAQREVPARARLLQSTSAFVARAPAG